MSSTIENTTNAKDEPELETVVPDATDKVELNLQMPLNAPMSGQNKASLVYHPLRTRLTSTLGYVKDTLTRDKAKLVALYAPSDLEEAARVEFNTIKSQISGLNYDLKTDKPFRDFGGQAPDRDAWNQVLRSLPKDERFFYRGSSLTAECYFNRKLYSFVENSVFFKDYDYFGKYKEQTLTLRMDEVLALVKYTRRSARDLQVFTNLLKTNMWSWCTGEEEVELLKRKVLKNVETSDEYVLVNDALEIWRCLDNGKNLKKTTQVDIVVGNAGYELFTLLILAEYMIEKGLATKVRFHVKAHPWCVQDATEKDFRWTLEYLGQQEHYLISLVGKKFVQFLDEGKFELAPISRFWTSPHPFCNMIRAEPELYSSLELSNLVIFKGEMNWRKLMQDVCSKSAREMRSCVKGFLPSNLCVLRCVCGLDEEAKPCSAQEMASGKYGVIQFISKARKPGV